MSGLKSIRFWRRLVQMGVVLAFIAIPILNWYEINWLSGNFLSLNFAGLSVIDPMAALQVWLGSFSVTPRMLTGVGLILMLAILMGPVFCSWICPYGFFSELLYGLKIGDKDGRTAKNSPPVSAKPYKVKLAIAGIGLLGVALFVPFPWLNQISMPGWYSRIMQELVMYGPAAILSFWLGLLLMLAVLAAEKDLDKRFWCRYVCPQSLLLNLCGMILPQRFQLHFERRKCICPAQNRLCGKACSLNLDPRSPAKAKRLQCTNCGDCVDACKTRGCALSLGFGRNNNEK